MLIFPAIDLYEGKAVRLYKGNYDEMTVYSTDPVSVARDFKAQGAEQMHTVDLEGARDGGTPNLGMIERIVAETGLFVECGGGMLPVPAVVGTARKGMCRPAVSTSQPIRASMLSVFWLMTIRTPFAVSIPLPPPTAKMLSQPCSLS